MLFIPYFNFIDFSLSGLMFVLKDANLKRLVGDVTAEVTELRLSKFLVWIENNKKMSLGL